MESMVRAYVMVLGFRYWLPEVYEYYTKNGMRFVKADGLNVPIERIQLGIIDPTHRGYVPLH